MRKFRILAVAAIGLGAALLLWPGRSTENAAAPGAPQDEPLPAPRASDPPPARARAPRPQLPGLTRPGTAQPQDPDAWAGGRPVQRMRLAAAPAAGAHGQDRPESGPRMTPAEESAFLAARHQALAAWSAAAQQAVAACAAPVAPAAPAGPAPAPVAVPVDVSFAPRAAVDPDAQQHVFVAEWLHASPPHLDALPPGRDRHVLEACLARLQAIELHIDAAVPIGPDLRLAESVAIQM